MRTGMNGKRVNSQSHLHNAHLEGLELPSFYPAVENPGIITRGKDLYVIGNSANVTFWLTSRRSDGSIHWSSQGIRTL